MPVFSISSAPQSATPVELKIVLLLLPPAVARLLLTKRNVWGKYIFHSDLHILSLYQECEL